MPTRYIHGLSVEMAYADGELLDYRVEDAEELRKYLCDDIADQISGNALAEYAVGKMQDEIDAAADWPLMSLDEQYGVSNRDFYDPRRHA